jgi:hypothetical protein
LVGWFPGLKRRAEIGVGTKVRFAPPSEPDWQISCIRLSSRCLTFKKIGNPQRALVLRKTSQERIKKDRSGKSENYTADIVRDIVSGTLASASAQPLDEQPI